MYLQPKRRARAWVMALSGDLEVTQKTKTPKQIANKRTENAE